MIPQKVQVKNITGKGWVGVGRNWIFPLTQLAELIFLSVSFANSVRKIIPFGQSLVFLVLIVLERGFRFIERPYATLKQGVLRLNDQ